MAHDIFCDFLTTTEMDVFSLKVTKDGHRISRVVIGGKLRNFANFFVTFFINCRLVIGLARDIWPS